MAFKDDHLNEIHVPSLQKSEHLKKTICYHGQVLVLLASLKRQIAEERIRGKLLADISFVLTFQHKKRLFGKDRELREI